MWSLLFYLFVYLRINQAFEKIQTRYHVAFYVQVIIWALTLWASVLFQVRNDPTEKSTCDVDVTKELNRWVVSTAVFGLLIGVTIFVFSYRYGSSYDMQCLKCIENFNLIHSEERFKFYVALYKVIAKDEHILEENNLSEEEKQRHMVNVVQKKLDENPDLTLEKALEILENLKVVTAFSSNIVTRRQFFNAGIYVDIEPSREDGKQIMGLKMNRMTSRNLDISIGKYMVPAVDLLYYKDDEAKTYPRASNTWFEKNKKSLKSNRVVFRLDSGIRQEFEKDWLWTDASTGASDKKLGVGSKKTSTVIKNAETNTIKLIDFEKWCLRYKWSLHPDNGKKMLLDWREELAQWELKHYFGNVIVPRHYVVVDEEADDLFVFDKGAHKLKRKDFENNINLDIQDGDGVLIKQSKFEGLVQGTDNQLYFEEHHTDIRITNVPYIKAYVVTKENQAGEVVYHVMLELDVLKSMYAEDPEKLAQLSQAKEENLIFTEAKNEDDRKWPMKYVNEHAQKLNKDLQQFIEDGYLDFKSNKYSKEDQLKLISRQVNNMLQLEPLSAGFKMAHYRDNVEEHRFTVISVDPCHFTIERSSTMFRLLLTLFPIDLFLGLWGIYVTSLTLEYNCVSIRSVFFTALFSFFWLNAIIGTLSYTIAKRLGKICCAYRSHEGHGFGLKYTRQAKSFKMSDVIRRRRQARRRSSIFNDLYDLVQGN